MSAALDVYGLRVHVDGDWPEVIDEVVADFAWFRDGAGSDKPAVRVAIRRGAPDFDAFGGLKAAFVTPRNVVYQDGQSTIVDYFGRAMSVLDRHSGELTVHGDSPHLVREAAYLFLLSRVGEHLDARGLTRLHALGLTGRHGAVAVLLPSGGGKSTLALHALRDGDCRLLSDDSPVIDRRGMVHPFPLRIGINAANGDELGLDRRARRLERMEFQPKLAVDVDAFAESVARGPHPLRHLVIGHRTLARSARLERLPRAAAAGPLLREAVVGVGIYQGMEFVLQRGLRDVAGKLGVAVTRSTCSIAGLARAKVWRLSMGRDHERNWEALRPLLDR